MKKVVTCTGYHGTGSSVITDMLKEFSNVKSFGDFEFRFLQDPNGVGELEERLVKNNCRLNSDRAIYDFRKFIKQLVSRKRIKFWKKSEYEIVFKNQFYKLTEEYIEDLVEFTWNGMWHDIYNRKEGKKYRGYLYIQNFLKKININLKPLTTKLVYSYPYNDFKSKTKKYINKLLLATEAKEETLVFDQLIPVCNTNKYLDYFENIKVIIIDRDPRDLYILNKLYWNDKVVPTETVEDFISYFKLIRKYKEVEEFDKNKVLEISFENLVYDYELSLQKILKFLKLENEKHLKKYEFFDPNKSINNTQLFNLHLELKKDIRKIEKELGDYCYSFPYAISHNKNIF